MALSLSQWELAGKSFFSATIRDISERKLAEQTILQQRELLSNMIESIPIGIFAKDAKNDYQFSIWNKGMENIFGIVGDDVLDKSDFDIINLKEEAQYYRDTDIAVMDGHETIDIPSEDIVTSEGNE